MNELKKRRKALGLSLDELAGVLGAGFSRARLSIAERNLIEVSKSEREVILAAIERLGALRSQIRCISETAASVDLIGLCADIRDRAASLHAAA